jgi:hypothetical protein
MGASRHCLGRRAANVAALCWGQVGAHAQPRQAPRKTISQQGRCSGAVSRALRGGSCWRRCGQRRGAAPPPAVPRRREGACRRGRRASLVVVQPLFQCSGARASSRCAHLGINERARPRARRARGGARTARGAAPGARACARAGCSNYWVCGVATRAWIPAEQGVGRGRARDRGRQRHTCGLCEGPVQPCNWRRGPDVEAASAAGQPLRACIKGATPYAWELAYWLSVIDSLCNSWRDA